MKDMRLVSLLVGILVFRFVDATAADEPITRPEIAKLGKAACVLIEVGKATGSGFCIHPSGWFVTNEHVVSKLGNNERATLVLNAGLPSQKTYKANLVRQDKTFDLALLKVESEGDIPALAIGTGDELVELAELIAFGFPLGTALAEKGRYPAISTNVVNISSLRLNDTGELQQIQVDSSLTFGHSGAPLLDRFGRVAGVVVSGVPGTGINLAIPVTKLRRFLEQPLIAFTPPELTTANQHGAVSFQATTVVFPASDEPLELELMLTAVNSTERRFAMLKMGNAYVVEAVPFPEKETEQQVRVELSFSDSLIRGSMTDREFLLSERRLKLSEVKRIHFSSPAEVVLRDDSKLSGTVSQLNDLVLSVGNQQLNVKSVGAIEFNVLSRPERAPLFCTVIARREGAEIGRTSSELYPEGALIATLEAIHTSKFHRPSRSPSPLSYFKIESSAGDYIGQGKKYDYEKGQLTITGSETNLSVRADGWQCNVAAPRGGKLKVGELFEAKRFPFNEDAAGFNFSGNGRGCNQLAAKFVVWELEVANGEVVRLAVDFLQRCENSGPPLCGMLRYNSTFR